MRWKNSVLAAAVCIAVLMLTFGIPTAAARGTSGPTTAGPANHTIVVLPNGHDDTADIQAAFNACGSYGPGCTVELVKGTYYTAQIAVYGFQGSFVGAGQGRTVIQALPNLPAPNPTYNTATVPFWAGNPTGAAGSNPWPDLFTFVGGTFSISGMTINELNANPITSPGWEGVTALYAVILVTGEQADAAIAQVTVNGAAGDITGYAPGTTVSFSFNLDASIEYMGMFLPAGWSLVGNYYTEQIPLSGMFSLTDSVISWSASAFWFENLLSATVSVDSNVISSSPSPGSTDLSNSQLFIAGNVITNLMIGALVLEQSYYKTNLLPSTVYVTGNYIATNWGGSGPFVIDLGTPSTLSAVITGNTVVTDTSCGCYNPGYPVIGAIEADMSQVTTSILVSHNTILGGGNGISFLRGPNTVVSDNYISGAMIGVLLGCYPVTSVCLADWGFNSTATGVLVTGNVIKNSLVYGIAVMGYSNDNVVAWNSITGTASGGYDLYWDLTGTGNVWFGNYCGDHTSSPPGLC